MKFLAIIPARGGSKRLPGKNKLDLAGKPLIAWTIEAALRSKLLSDVLVSTDDQETAEISKKAGANVPFLRPAELSTDTATSFQVVQHALDFIKNYSGTEPEFVVLLQPTSPFRDDQDIDNAIGMLTKKNADAVISVCKMDHSPLLSNTLPDDGDMKNFIRPDVAGMRTQDMPAYYRINGAIYINRTKILLKEKSLFFKENIFAYKMEKDKSADIDSDEEFRMAELLMRSRLSP